MLSILLLLSFMSHAHPTKVGAHAVDAHGARRIVVAGAGANQLVDGSRPALTNEEATSPDCEQNIDPAKALLIVNPIGAVHFGP